jgi:hypothetical protein
MTLPISRQREGLLQECLAWVGKYYEGGSVADACHFAVREVLNLPLDSRPLRRDMFVGGEYQRVHIPFGELLGLGLIEGVEASDVDLRLAASIRRELFRATHQPDLTEAQQAQIRLEAMVAALERWLTWTPGGLAEAVQDLFVLYHGGYSTSPFG